MNITYIGLNMEKIVQFQVFSSIIEYLFSLSFEKIIAFTHFFHGFAHGAFHQHLSTTNLCIFPNPISSVVYKAQRANKMLHFQFQVLHIVYVKVCF